MSETSLPREPLELVEIQFPKCAYSYGCGGCDAGLGNVAPTDMTIDFARFGTGPSIAGGVAWTFVNQTITRIPGGLRLMSTTADPQSSIPGTSGVSFSGDDYRYVVLHGRRVSGTANITGIDMTMWWFNTDGHTPVGGEDAKAKNRLVGFGPRYPRLSSLVDGQEFIAVFDAADSTVYATDWVGKTIDGIRFDLTNGTGVEYEYYSVKICSRNPLDNLGQECFNTRATCQAPLQYSDEPAENLDPTATASNGGTIDPEVLNSLKDVFMVAEVRFDLNPSGTIFDISGLNRGTFLGVTGTDLVFRAGSVATTPDDFVARVTTPVAPLAGRTLWVIGEVYIRLTSADSVRLWTYDPTTLELELLGEAFAPVRFPLSGWNQFAGDGLVGDDLGNIVQEDGGVWNGDITRVLVYTETLFPHGEDAEFRLPLLFGRQDQARPDSDQTVIPLLADVSTVGSKINLAGTDDRYSAIGSRAILEFSMTDAPATDRGVDPYYADRLYRVEDGSRGMFWERNYQRQKIGKVSAIVNVYDGYANGRLEQMRRRTYVLDKIDFYGRTEVDFRCRDVLARTEFSKAQTPPPSRGELELDLSDVATTFGTVSNTPVEYPASGGIIRINDEVMTYTGFANDGDETFTFTGVTRGQFNTVASEHGAGDTVQLCRRYDNETVNEVLIDLLSGDARIEAQFLDLEGFADETETFLSAYLLDGLITAPVPTDELLGELAEQCPLYIWWDERDQKIRMKAVRPINAPAPILNVDDNLVADSVSFKEMPKQRISEVWVFYNQKDPTRDLDDDQNYANIYVGVVPDDPYPVRAIRTIYSRFLKTEAQVLQTASRLNAQFEEIPVEVTFRLDAKDSQYWVGDYVRIPHYRRRTAQGEIDNSRVYTITSAREVMRGEMLEYTALDITIAGFIYKITENGIGDYTPELFEQLNAFITDNEGNNPDGTKGARIT